MNKLKALSISIILLASISLPAQTLISNKQIPGDRDLLFAIKNGIPGLEAVYHARDNNNTDEAVKLLADFLKDKISDRYYFGWKNFKKRFSDYGKLFPGMEQEHIKIAAQHSSMFPSTTKWKLPFKNLKGNDVTAYELRHLARQHKSVDAALSYYYRNEDQNYLDYFIGQVKSLNDAFANNEYDNEGNGIYESFRAGYRMQNWLFVYNAFLASEKYSTGDQVLLLKTFLQTAASLQKSTKKFSFGNHHTKGLTALFLVSAMFPEFTQSDEWQKQAIEGLVLHLQREINDDGFQSERTVHYHMGDIDNYFYVYQIAKINSIKLPEEFNSRFRLMFDALVKLAQPDKCIQVLQDDTDSPYKDKNDISNAMTIGTILFQDPVYNYFTKGNITADMYWYFKPTQTAILKTPAQVPAIGSTALKNTGYYIMRNGWKENDMQMVVSAGLYDKKPDHQHGDMLGITAYAFGNEILPGYIVRYANANYPFFKNSFAKNVAIVNGIPQGRGWQKNEGESGFGKWRFLPAPETISWFVNNNYDYYCGTHNGYDSLNVKYFRQVYFIKDGFWLVKDDFQSAEKHDYYQIWQGHYKTVEKDIHIASKFENGAALDIIQLNGNCDSLRNTSLEEKGASIFISKDRSNYSFVTLLYPSMGISLDSDALDKSALELNGWMISKNSASGEIQSDARVSLYKNGEYIFLNVGKIRAGKIELTFTRTADASVKFSNGEIELYIKGSGRNTCSVINAELVELNDAAVGLKESYPIYPNDKMLLK